MPIKYIVNWKSNKINQIIDVRSPDEYSEDHIPNSLNVPVLNNNERKLSERFHEFCEALSTESLPRYFPLEFIQTYKNI